jgi:putative ABC transport system substrate-binding protein
MNRRDLLLLAAGAAVVVPTTGGTQPSAMPVIGFVHLHSPELTREYLAAFHRGLGDSGFVEGKNLRIEYRWGGGRNDRLPSLIAELVARPVSVLVVLESTLGALAAKAATKSIPVVFMQGADPVRIGLVDTLSWPGGNLTGIDLLLAAVAAKRLQLLRELLPAAKSIGYLRNPTNPVYAEFETSEVQAAARLLGMELTLMNSSTLGEIEAAFAKHGQQPVDALFVSSDGFLLNHSDRIADLAARHALPAIYGWRQAVALGGLISYGTYFPVAWRQAGAYAARILKGEKPADLPVQEVTKLELLINLKTAKALGVAVPQFLLARADEVIE